MTEQMPSSDDKRIFEGIQNSFLFSDFDASDVKQLAGYAELKTLGKGEILFTQGKIGDAIYIVLTGALAAWAREADDKEEAKMGDIGPGDPVGEIQLFSGSTHTATVKAVVDSELIRIPESIFDQIAHDSPQLVGRINELIQRRFQHNQFVLVLTELFGAVDDTVINNIEKQIQWKSIKGGQCLFKQGDPDDSFYILISGRLQAVLEESGGERKVVGEIVRGECIGEMAIFTDDPRSASIFAIRDSELVRLSKTNMEKIVQQHPNVMFKITQILISRLRKSLYRPPARTPAVNIALISANCPDRLEPFAVKLAETLNACGTTLHLSSQRIEAMTGMAGTAQMSDTDSRNVRLNAWLDEQETRSRFVLYQADPTESNWTKRCLRNADQVLIIGDAQGNPNPDPMEVSLLHSRESITQARRHLILIHKDRSASPTGTPEWLASRKIDNHMHLVLDRKEDFDRLERQMNGRAVGLVLGGGGARGLAHIGILKAFEENNIPIDMVAGTSMGAIIASLYAKGLSPDDIRDIIHKYFVEIKPLNEYTLPLIALLRSKKLDRVNQMAFGEMTIEDLWLNFFCISSNLTTAQMMIHRTGPVWQATRASSSIPGLALPVIDGDNLLVDGAVFNNLPSDVMGQLFGGLVITVDVGMEKELAFNDDMFPSPWKLLLKRLGKKKNRPAVPNIMAILTRTSMLYSVSKTKSIRDASDIYMHPPISQFSLLEFEAIDSLVDIGYRYAMEEIPKCTDRIRSCLA